MSFPKHSRDELDSPCTTKRARKPQHVFTVMYALEDQAEVEVVVCGDEQAHERVLSDRIFQVLAHLHFFTALAKELRRPLSICLHEEGGEAVSWRLEQIAARLDQVFSFDTLGGVTDISREEVDFQQLVPLLQRLRYQDPIDKSAFSAAELKMIWDKIACSPDNADWLRGAYIISRRSKVEY